MSYVPSLRGKTHKRASTPTGKCSIIALDLFFLIKKAFDLALNATWTCLVYTNGDGNDSSSDCCWCSIFYSYSSQHRLRLCAAPHLWSGNTRSHVRGAVWSWHSPRCCSKFQAYITNRLLLIVFATELYFGRSHGCKIDTLRDYVQATVATLS